MDEPEIPEAIRKQSEAMKCGQRFLFGSGDRRRSSAHRDEPDEAEEDEPPAA